MAQQQQPQHGAPPYNSSNQQFKMKNMPMTVSQQPVPGMPMPQYGQGMAVPADMPRGLEYLAMVDQLLIQQQMELLEILTGFETKNKYVLKNSLGQQVYFAAEKSGCCVRCCCGPIRPFEMKILDNFNTEVLHFNRPLNCDSCLFPCCLQVLEVSSPMTGSDLGTIEQNWSIVRPKFTVKNAQGDAVLKVEGPLMTCSCCCNDVVFKILSADGEKQIGNITKQWSGFCKEGWTDADNFSVTFPMDLDVTVKAVLLGAVFLIDFMYFERTNQNNG